MTDTALGHNLPPADANPLRERLETEHVELIARHAALTLCIRARP